MKLHIEMKNIIASLSICGLILSGCSTTGGSTNTQTVAAQLGKQAVSVLGNVAFDTLASVAQAEMTGTKVDFGHAIASSLWNQAPAILSSTGLGQTALAASGGTLPTTAKTAAQVYLQVAPKTPEQRTAVINAIASTISSVALKKS